MVDIENTILPDTPRLIMLGEFFLTLLHCTYLIYLTGMKMILALKAFVSLTVQEDRL